MRRLTQAGLMLLIAAVIGCSPAPKKMKFNNMIARANSDLKAKARAFYKVIYLVGKGQPVTGAQARAALKEIETTLDKTKKEFADLKSPVNSPSGATMLEKYRAFLTTEQDIVDQCLKPIVDAIEKNAANWPFIEALLKKADELERNAYNDLAKAQTDYSEAHKFKLMR